jgi:hypothetical protein
MELSDTDSDMDIISDTDSILSSASDLSIYHEFDKIIAEVHNIQQTCEEAHDRITNLSNIVSTLQQDTLYIHYQDTVCHFDNVLEEFHQKALLTIQHTGENTFGSLLLNILDSAEFTYT